MGRDNGKPVAGLHGGTAPAKAFADYMKVAVANRPIEQFGLRSRCPNGSWSPMRRAISASPMTA